MDGEHAMPMDENSSWDQHINFVLRGLEKIYFQRLRPIEAQFDYDLCCPTWFGESMVQKRPFVTFLGPFSSGKSTFINYLLQGNLLASGAQPVTDKFTVVMHGNKIQKIPGRVLLADANHPFRGLNQLGGPFAEVFEGITHPHPILQSVTFIDTPGVLETTGSFHSRRYDYINACRWFVEKSDLVFVLFDPTKLDSGEELRRLFRDALRGHEGKLRVVLNKADTVEPQELMRVYGALFWNLSGLVATTEPPRVYISSFWDQPYRSGTDHGLFTEEKADLIYDLTEVVPLQALDLRVAAVMQRATRVILFALLCATFKSEMPLLFGKDKAKKKFIERLPEICNGLASKYRYSARDFPRAEELAKFFMNVDYSKFLDMKQLQKKKWIELVRITLDVDLPKLLKPIKETPVADPNDRRHVLMLQREYFKKAASEIPGQHLMAGVSDHMAAAAGSYPQMLYTSSPEGRVLCDGTGHQMQAHQGPGQFTGEAAGMNPSQMTMMMQMMANMMAMQQQDQRRAIQAVPEAVQAEVQQQPVMEPMFGGLQSAEQGSSSMQDGAGQQFTTQAEFQYPEQANYFQAPQQQQSQPSPYQFSG